MNVRHELKEAWSWVKTFAFVAACGLCVGAFAGSVSLGYNLVSKLGQ